MPIHGTALSARLTRLDRAQLLDLVGRLVERQPGLEDLVFLPLAGEEAPLDIARVRVEVRRILDGVGYDWRLVSPAWSAVQGVVAIADRYLERAAIANAAAVYAAIATTICERFETFRDEDGQIGQIVFDCCEGLDRCLEQAQVDERWPILQGLLGVFRWDSLEQGGYGLGEPACAVILARATPDERARLAAEVRELVRSLRGDDLRWRKAAGGRLVLQLIDAGGDAERMRICEETGLDVERVRMLLARGDVGSALDVLRGAEARDVVRIASALVAAGHREAAVAAVRAHPAVLETGNHDVQAWLTAQGSPLGKDTEQLRYLIDRFGRRPGVSRFEELLELAERVGRRDEVVQRALATLRPDDKARQAIRVRALAAAGALDEAAALLASLPEGTWNRAALAVARASTTSRPALALELYEQLIDRARRRGTKPARADAALWQQEVNALRHPTPGH